MKEKKKRFKHEHGSSFSVDYYAYASHMRSWNAGFKVLFSIISLLICIACNNLFVSLAVIFFMGFLVDWIYIITLRCCLFRLYF